MPASVVARSDTWKGCFSSTDERGGARTNERTCAGVRVCVVVCTSCTGSLAFEGHTGVRESPPSPCPPRPKGSGPVAPDVLLADALRSAPVSSHSKPTVVVFVVIVVTTERIVVASV